MKETIAFMKVHVKELLAEKETIIIALPGGRSVQRLFDEMIKSSFPWERIHFFMIDERLVPSDHKDSNFKMLKEKLFTKLYDKGLPKKNVHPFRLKKKEDRGILDYQEELIQYGGVYDIVVLGVGEDGHVGALYPHHTVEVDTPYYLWFDDSPKPPKERMTASRTLLLGAHACIVLFIGKGKKNAYKDFKDKKKTWSDCPAKLADEIMYTHVVKDLK